MQIRSFEAFEQATTPSITAKAGGCRRFGYREDAVTGSIRAEVVNTVPMLCVRAVR
jgi:hypothetical protein